MTPAGYQILWRRFYTDKDGGWMSGWEDFWNHKLYSSEKNAQEAIGYIKRDAWFNSAEFKIVPLYYSESFKSALREEIENDMTVRGAQGDYADGRTWAFKRVLALLDTITPKQ